MPWTKIAQGIFALYGVTVEDEASGKREGGFGSANESSQSAPEAAGIVMGFVDGIAQAYSITGRRHNKESHGFLRRR